VSRTISPPSEDAMPIWEASKEHRFVLPWCLDCERTFWYPRVRCPYCLSPRLEWREASGRGTVYALSVMHLPATPEYKDRVPYIVAMIDLDEGARMMSNIFGIDPAAAKVGMAVQIAWEDLDDGRALPVFEPAPSA
jgi:uncharacterized OB-fold protein